MNVYNLDRTKTVPGSKLSWKDWDALADGKLEPILCPQGTVIGVKPAPKSAEPKYALYLGAALAFTAHTSVENVAFAPKVFNPELRAILTENAVEGDEDALEAVMAFDGDTESIEAHNAALEEAESDALLLEEAAFEADLEEDIETQVPMTLAEQYEDDIRVGLKASDATRINRNSGRIAMGRVPPKYRRKSYRLRGEDHTRDRKGPQWAKRAVKFSHGTYAWQYNGHILVQERKFLNEDRFELFTENPDDHMVAEIFREGENALFEREARYTTNNELEALIEHGMTMAEASTLLLEADLYNASEEMGELDSKLDHMYAMDDGWSDPFAFGSHLWDECTCSMCNPWNFDDSFTYSDPYYDLDDSDDHPDSWAMREEASDHEEECWEWDDAYERWLDHLEEMKESELEALVERFELATERRFGPHDWNETPERYRRKAKRIAASMVRKNPNDPRWRAFEHEVGSINNGSLKSAGVKKKFRQQTSLERAQDVAYKKLLENERMFRERRSMRIASLREQTQITEADTSVTTATTSW